MKIDDVQKTTIKQLFSSEYILWSILVILLTVISSIYFKTISPLIVAFVYFVMFWIKNQKKFMKEFAKENNFIYQEKIEVNSLKGKLFEIGSGKIAFHALLGKYLEYPIKIFNYMYTSNESGQNEIHSFTVCEIEIINVNFPYIYLKSHEIPEAIASRDNRLKLENEFESEFDLYCTHDYEIEVLQIFTPQLLRYLKENGKHFNIEFSKNKIYFYDDLIIGNKKDMNCLYEVVKKVLDKTGLLLERLKDDFEALDEAKKI